MLVGAGKGLRDSAWIDLAAVTAEQARRYLDGRAVHNGWQPVLNELAQHPQGRLAAALSTPWQLTLAATVYADGGDPERLCVRAADGGIQAHLLAEFLPASVRLHPREPARYDAQAVQRWLGLLARHLRTVPSAIDPTLWNNRSARTGVAHPHPPAAPDRDIVPHQLWLLAGPRRVRLFHLAVCSVLVALAAAGFGLLASLTSYAPPLPFVAAAAVVVCLWGLWQWSQPWPRPRQLVPYRKLGPGDSCLVVAAMLTTLFATVLSIMADINPLLFPRGVLTALGAGAGIVMLTSTIFLGKATSQPADAANRAASDPRLLLRGDLVSGLLVAMVFGLVVGVAAGVTMAACTACCWVPCRCAQSSLWRTPGRAT